METTEKKFVIYENNVIIDDSLGYGYTKEEAITRLSELAGMENFSDYFDDESAREYVLEGLNEIAEYEEREVTEDEIQNALKWYEGEGWYKTDGEPFLFYKKGNEYYSIGAKSYSIEEMDYAVMGLNTKWTDSNFTFNGQEHFTLNEILKICPRGFRLPTREEVENLFTFSEVSFDKQRQECIFKDMTRSDLYPTLRIPIRVRR